jgi:hypothetical protein
MLRKQRGRQVAEARLPFQKVGRYRRERLPKERERSAQAWSVRLPLASSLLPALAGGLRRGRPTFADRY